MGVNFGQLLAVLGKEGPFWGGVDTTSYAILLVLHLTALVMVFGPMLLVGTLVKTGAREAFATVSRSISTLVIPGLVLSLATGVTLALNSNGVFSLGAPWISGAFTVYFVLLGFSIYLLRRLGHAQNGTSLGEAARASLQRTVLMSAGIFHASLVVLLVLMIGKPGQ